MSRGSFFNRPAPAVTALLQETTPEGFATAIHESVRQGADAIAVQLSFIEPDLRTVSFYRDIMAAAPELPFMFILYRNDKWLGGDDEARQKYLLDTLEAGAEVVDVMGDLFDPQPLELALAPAAIQKQKELIEEIHRRGGKVIMSSHIYNDARNHDQILEQMRHQEERGADILKLVALARTQDELLEAIRTDFELKKELSTPFVHLSNGAFNRPHRFLGPKLGNCLTFAMLTESAEGQPTVEQFRAVLDNFHWTPPA